MTTYCTRCKTKTGDTDGSISVALEQGARGARYRKNSTCEVCGTRKTGYVKNPDVGLSGKAEVTVLSDPQNLRTAHQGGSTSSYGGGCLTCKKGGCLMCSAVDAVHPEVKGRGQKTQSSYEGEGIDAGSIIGGLIGLAKSLK